MKSLVFALITLFSVGAGADTYCRSVERDGMFGQPKGTFEHCVTLSDKYLTDNGDSFFGNPPSTNEYQIRNSNLIYILVEAVPSQSKPGQEIAVWQFAYKIVGNTLVNEVGSVLTKK